VDLDEQLDLARWAVDLVERDIHATLPDRPTIAVDDMDGEGVRIAYNGSYCAPVDLSPTPARTLAEVADYLQDQVCDRWWDDPSLGMWPVCSEHNRGLHATVGGDAAVWQCSAGPHTIARIGHLGA